MGKFRIKISSWWASSDYVQFKYSTNRIIWKRIYACEHNIMDGYCYMRPLTTHYSNTESTIHRFNCLDDVLKFEKLERDKVNRHNNDRIRIEKQQSADRKSVYKRFGK